LETRSEKNVQRKTTPVGFFPSRRRWSHQSPIYRGSKIPDGNSLRGVVMGVAGNWQLTPTPRLTDEAGRRLNSHLMHERDMHGPQRLSSIKKWHNN